MIALFLLIFFPMSAHADRVKTLKVCENSVADVMVSPQGTVLDFPIEPEKVILGTKNSFHIEYVKTDLALSPTSSGSKSNLFVYLLGRRFVFELRTAANAQTLYFVRDCKDVVPVRKSNARK